MTDHHHALKRLKKYLIDQMQDSDLSAQSIELYEEIERTLTDALTEQRRREKAELEGLLLLAERENQRG